MNFIQIAGHLGADPETRFTQSGKKVTTLRVATNSRKGGQDVTIWWRVTIWEEEFKNMIPHLKKGSAVLVFGEMLKPEIFNDKEGKPQVAMEMRAVHLQFSPFGKPGGSQPQQTQGQEARPTAPAGAAPFGSFQESSFNPYMGFPGTSPSAPAGGSHGSTFDDEVPF